MPRAVSKITGPRLAPGIGDHLDSRPPDGSFAARPRPAAACEGWTRTRQISCACEFLQRRQHQAAHGVRVDGQFAAQNAAGNRQRQLDQVASASRRSRARNSASSSMERASRSITGCTSAGARLSAGGFALAQTRPHALSPLSSVRYSSCSSAAASISASGAGAAAGLPPDRGRQRRTAVHTHRLGRPCGVVREEHLRRHTAPRPCPSG